MPHSPVFRTTGTKYIVIPPSFFAHTSAAGRSTRSSRTPPGHPVNFSSPTKMSFASQQAARLAQQRVAKEKEAMTKGTSSTWASSATKVSRTSSSSSTSPSPRVHSLASSTKNYNPSISLFSSSGSQEISRTLETLRNMEERLDDLLSKWQIPDHLEFISTHLDPQYSYHYSQNGPLTHLSITSQNFPVIALGELLNLLEQELGFVEANGNNYIEVRKKKIANRIKETTADLERRVHDLWWTALSKQAITEHFSCPTTAVPVISF